MDPFPAITNSRGMAIADPVFRFDQAGFDQDMADQGLASFPLAEYFEFTYSPGLLEASPVILDEGFESP